MALKDLVFADIAVCEATGTSPWCLTGPEMPSAEISRGRSFQARLLPAESRNSEANCRGGERDG